MKSKFLALTVALATLSFAPASAQNAQTCPYAKMLSKTSADLPTYRASDVAPIALVGSPTATYTRLSFTRHTHLHSAGIHPHKKGTKFKLERGTYLISFTGTAQSTAGDISLIDVALQLGDEIIGVNTNAIETGFDNFQILSTSIQINLDKKTRVSVIARNRATGTTTNMLHRTISIIRLN